MDFQTTGTELLIYTLKFSFALFKAEKQKERNVTPLSLMRLERKIAS